MLSTKTIILGAGIAGISAAYHLKQKGLQSVIFEKDGDWGGLCGNFTIDGFRFDRFVHFTFADKPETAEMFEKSSPLYAHLPISYNYYHGYWLRHPAQNNLAPLPSIEKTAIIKDFICRPKKDVSNIADYEEWLRVQYGNYFAEHFPCVYTRKYWGREACQLETKWVGKRMYLPDIAEMLSGAFEEQTQNFYYTKYMKYPKKGGFRSILNTCRKTVDIRFNKRAERISPANRMVYFSDGTAERYERLISTVPLPDMVKMIDPCPQEVLQAAKNLHWTCGYQVSLGFNRPDVAKYLWFYIYDDDIPPARVYSPNLKSADNAPANCSSLQAEVFFADDAEIPTVDEILNKTVEKLKRICGFEDEDILVKDIRFESYANIIFTPEIYKNRKIVRDWLETQAIETIGRFGLWDYLWTHQAFESGKGI